MAIFPVLTTTTVLLFSYFHAESKAAAEENFVIRAVTLSIQPSNEVAWGANVTLRCQAALDVPATVEFTIYKGQNVVCTQTTSSSDDMRCPLSNLKMANSGDYRCRVASGDAQETSKSHELTVAGAPVLHVNPAETTEGDEITLNCVARERAAQFIFYKDSEKIGKVNVDATEAGLAHRVGSAGNHTFHCLYAVRVDEDTYRSGGSTTVTLSVKALAIAPVLEITGPRKIYEGDQLFLTCGTNTSLPGMSRTIVILKQGTKLLSRGFLRVNHSLLVLAKDPADFTCEAIVNRVVKAASKNISVAELFSVPTLTMSPAEVFQEDNMTLTCRSDRYARERLNGNQLMYTLDPPQAFLYSRSNGVFYGKAPKSEFNASCVARHKSVTKYSEITTMRPKVPVSVPEISVLGQAILGQPVKILCRSHAGSLPISYTLLRGNTTVRTTTVRLASEKAVFTVESAGDLRGYACEARNSRRNAHVSKMLISEAIVPLSHPIMIVVPAVAEITEGDHLSLICRVEGTPPVTFKWYRWDNDNPVHAVTSYINSSSYEIPVVSRKYSSRYRCEAVNPANNIVYSDYVDIHVGIALWKKALIGGACVLLVATMVVGLVLYFKFRRGLPARIQDGKEGRATNGLSPTGISHGSSDSIPAAV